MNTASLGRVFVFLDKLTFSSIVAAGLMVNGDHDEESPAAERLEPVGTQQSE